MNLLFIHHSCGGQWLADVGPADGADSIYRTHPNGGELRAALTQEGFRVGEASYRSAIGARTDLFDWLPKFRDHMAAVLHCRLQDESLPAGETNQVVLFKSCYPNNALHADGETPGCESGPELTVANARATYAALLPVFARHPETLFVAVTAPPLAPKPKPRPVWKRWLDRARGKDRARFETGARARRFNHWLAAADGWLRNYPERNVAVFDYYDVLTNHGESDFSCHPTGDGFDSHPSSEGNRRATAALVPWLQAAVRRHHAGTTASIG